MAALDDNPTRAEVYDEDGMKVYEDGPPLAVRTDVLAQVMQRLAGLEEALAMQTAPKPELEADALEDAQIMAHREADAEQRWVTEFIMAVRGYLTADMAETGENAAMKTTMRERVMRMLNGRREGQWEAR